MNPAMVAGAIRTGLAMLSGALVAGGIMDQGAADAAMTDLTAVLGGIGGLVTLAWSIYAKVSK